VVDDNVCPRVCVTPAHGSFRRSGERAPRGSFDRGRRLRVASSTKRASPTATGTGRPCAPAATGHRPPWAPAATDLPAVRPTTYCEVTRAAPRLSSVGPERAGSGTRSCTRARRGPLPAVLRGAFRLGARPNSHC
jgi:hypothetical protein